MTAADPEWKQAIVTLWSRQQRWSQHADALKQLQTSWSGPLAVLALAGTILSTLSPQIVGHYWPEGTSNPVALVLTIVGPALAALSTFLVANVLTPKSKQDWVNARMLSEALKTEGFIYLAGAPPYADPVKAPEELNAKIDQLVDEVKDVSQPRDTGSGEPKYPVEPLDRDSYISKRVAGQIKFHLEGAGEFDRKLRRWKAIGMALGGISAVLGVIAGIGNLVSLNVWVAVISAVLASMTSYVYARQFEVLAGTYYNTADRLDRLKSRWETSRDKSDEKWQRFVLDCEAVLAAQNRTWSNTLTKQASEQLQKANT